ncbi:hypothetical protein GAG94_03700 [Lysinibacillus sphaericus]|nr:hypothetical protein GAG94_03700 [Lysinibacillus sphaericus]
MLMKTLYFADQTYQAEEIVKTKDSIVGYVNGDKVFSIRGISDFSLFKLDEGQVFDNPKLSDVENLRLELARSNTQMMEHIIALTGVK